MSRWKAFNVKHQQEVLTLTHSSLTEKKNNKKVTETLVTRTENSINVYKFFQLSGEYDVSVVLLTELMLWKRTLN